MSKIVIRDQQHTREHRSGEYQLYLAIYIWNSIQSHLMLWCNAESISKSMSLLLRCSNMHLQAMRPVQALLLLLYECPTGQVAVSVTMNSTRTYNIPWKCIAGSIITCSCWLSMWVSGKHFGIVTITTGQVADGGTCKKAAFIILVRNLSGVSLTSVNCSCMHHNTFALSPALLG